MATIGNIVANLAVDSSKWSSGLRRGQKSVSTFSSSASSALNKVKGIAVGLFAGLTVAKFTGDIRSAMDSIDKLAKTSDKLNIATNELIALRHAAELTGAGTDALDNGLQRMIRNISEAATGTGIAVGALNELGLSAEKLNSLSPDKQFKTLADAVNSVQNPADKLRLTYELFGREGVKLVNTLRLGSEGLQDVAKDADELGLTMSRIDAAKIEGANDAVYRLGQLYNGVTQQLTIALAPALTATANQITDMFKGGKTGAEDMEGGVKVLVSGIGFLLDMVNGVKVAWQGVKTVFAETIQFISKGILAISKPLEDFAEKMGFTPKKDTFTHKLLDEFSKLGDEEAKKLDKMVDAKLPSVQLMEKYTKALEDAKKAQDNIIVPDDFAPPLQNAVNAIDWNKTGESLMGMVDGVSDWFGEAIKMNTPEVSKQASAPSTVLKNSKEYFQMLSSSQNRDPQIEVQKQQLAEQKKATNALQDMLAKLGAPQAINFLNLGGAS